MLAALLAAGVDPNRTCLYFQEDVGSPLLPASPACACARKHREVSQETDGQVPEHAELAWYLNTLTPVGHLKRMTTWKSKLVVSRNANSEDEVSEGELKLGLLSYPVLQAADIMLYK